MNEYKCYSTSSTTEEVLYIPQWSLNQSVYIDAGKVHSAPILYFSNNYINRVYTTQSSLADNGRVIAVIPNLLLQNDVPITIGIKDKDDDNDYNYIGSATVNIRKADKPTDYKYTENINSANDIQSNYFIASVGDTLAYLGEL